MHLHGWGRYPKHDCTVITPDSASEIASLVERGPLIARGGGRSYGDSALGTGLTVRSDNLTAITPVDPDTGILICESGATLATMLETLVPQGFMPFAMPGTQFASLGGMIAADVHGKDQHLNGSFGRHVQWMDVVTADGQMTRCSRSEHPDLFHATIGGMGLTGIIVRAALHTRRIESAWFSSQTTVTGGWEDTLDVLDRPQAKAHVVAWLDFHAPAGKLGRGVVQSGDIATPDELPKAIAEEPLRVSFRPPRHLARLTPPGLLNRHTIKLYNWHRWSSAHRARRSEIMDMVSFLFPLDAVADWNRFYGACGFAQYQFVLPHAGSRDGIRLIVEAVTASGMRPYLVTAKRLVAGDGILSFPMDGITLALDFPMSRDVPALFDRLDQITIDSGGRIYLAKDALTTPQRLEGMYGTLDRFTALRHDRGANGVFVSRQSERLGL